jgi:hypothetical protein
MPRSGPSPDSLPEQLTVWSESAMVCRILRGKNTRLGKELEEEREREQDD